MARLALLALAAAALFALAAAAAGPCYQQFYSCRTACGITNPEKQPECEARECLNATTSSLAASSTARTCG
jgi:hypothetical protein